MIQDFKEDYDHPMPFVKFYFRWVISVVINMLKGIPQKSIILDFGCGRQYLKKVSGLRNVVGYDIVSEFTELKDFRILKPDVIVCNHVLEHLDALELRETLDSFKMMKPKFIITGVPTENIISRLCAMIGRPRGYFEHKTKINIIHKELAKRFILLKRKNVMTLTIVSKWA